MASHDFTFAWEGASAGGAVSGASAGGAVSGASAPGGPWAHLEVVELRGTEEVSSLYRYEIMLLSRAPSPEVDPHDLVYARATLRIATGTAPAFKVVHGVIAEAEELATVAEGMLYRVVLVPPLVRASYRRRCRIFLEKTIRQIIDAVLTGDPLLARADGASVSPDDGNLAVFAPAAEQFTWRITNSPRVDQRFARPYCVQYNESDLAFVSRLLEEEGISYHFENGDGVCLLVLSDEDTGKARLDPFEPLGAIQGREVAVMKLGGRLRPKVVSMDDYNWKKPALDMRVEASADLGTGGLFEYHWPGGFPGEPAQGAPLARAAAERYGVEASYAMGEGYCRVLSAGSIFALRHAKARYEGEYLVTKLEVRGEQQGVLAPGAYAASGVPFSCRFECARRGREGSVAESSFRPERRTPRPRIHGSQTAFVTAEPSGLDAEVNVGDLIGCVRLRFHWDHDVERQKTEPSSCWVRVSQMFAGGGQGAVGHPRVGVEVIVEFLDGDPDRPIVTGRVYNGANLPPAVSVGSATTTAFKTFSVPGGAQYNELAFDDAAGAEELRLHAGRDWRTEVEHDRMETIKGTSISVVQERRWERTSKNRLTSVLKDNIERVAENERIKVGGNQSLGVLFNQNTSVGGDQGLAVTGSQRTVIGSGQMIKIGEPPGGGGTGDGGATLHGQQITVFGPQTTTVHEGQTTTIMQGGRTATISGNDVVNVSGSQEVAATEDIRASAEGRMGLQGGSQWIGAVNRSGGYGSQELVSKNLTVTALDTASVSATNALKLNTMSGGGTVTIQGSVIDVVGADGTNHIQIASGQITIQNASITVMGDPVKVLGTAVQIQSDTFVSLKGGVIMLNVG